MRRNTIPFVHIGTEKQLVLDNFILDHLDGVERVIPTPSRLERGVLRVAALDPYFKPYDGFAADDCAPVTTDRRDQVWHTVSWRGSASVAALWDKPVRLRVLFEGLRLEDARLYAVYVETTS